MKKITLLFILCIASITLSYGQCTTNTGGQWPTATVNVANSGGAETIAADNWPNAEFSLLTGILPGSDYTVAAAGITPNVYITVTNTANNAVIVSGLDSVSFTAGVGITALTIYWHLDAACGTQTNANTLTTIQCTTCTCTETVAPNPATTPTPGDTAVDIPITGTVITPFSWVDATTGPAAQSYDLTLGTDIAGTNIGTITGATNGNGINYPNWANNTTYYWRVDAINCFGVTTGTVWSFTTANCTAAAAPNITSTPSPADAATNVPIGGPDGLVNFSWVDGVGGDPAESFILNIDTVNPPVANSFAFNSGDPITGLAVSTTYFWSVDAINCAGTTPGTVWSFTTDATLSIDDNEIAQPFKIYPNPTSDILNIKTSLDIDNITVFNLLGQRVANFNKNSVSNNSINLSELSQGLYIIKISAGDRTQTFKITKE